MPCCHRCAFATLTLVLLVGSPVRAQWSSDPATNLAVSDAPGAQVQPKVAPTADGGCWISWLGGSGYDVRVQRLDAGGNELLVSNGVLVADRGVGSTQDYGLDTDATGNALLAFRDDRGTGVQVTAAKVSPTGTLLWGAAGIQLTSTTGFVASPRIAGTSDGGAVIAWTQDASARLEKLDASGGAVWGGGITLTPGAGSYSPSDIHDAGNDVILAFVHQTGGFGSPRHLLAQKYDASGSPLWGAAHVAVFDGGSLQFGNFPEFAPDGSGGGVFSWYDTSSLALQCFAQRVLANGTEAFAHDGVAVSTNASRIRVSPSAGFDSATSELFVFWKEQNSAQSQSGVYGQKLDAAGSRQWGSDGVEVVAVGTDDISLVRCVPSGGGAFGFWSEAPSFGQDRLYGAHVDGSGAIAIAPFDVASTPSSKSRLDVDLSTSGFAILAWSDERVDSGDILAQNVNADGSLGGGAVAVPLGHQPGTDAQLGRPWPNPTPGPTQISFDVPGTAPVVIDVIDVRGRIVRTLFEKSAPRRGRVSWDGRDDRGQPVAGGVYFLRLSSAGSSTSESVIVIP